MKNVVYVFSDEDSSDERYKVGSHTGDLKKLIKRNVTSVPKIKVHYFIETNNAETVEANFKVLFTNKRIPNCNGNLSEWVRAPLYEIVSALLMLIFLPQNNSISIHNNVTFIDTNNTTVQDPIPVNDNIIISPFQCISKLLNHQYSSTKPIAGSQDIISSLGKLPLSTLDIPKHNITIIQPQTPSNLPNFNIINPHHAIIQPQNVTIIQSQGHLDNYTNYNNIPVAKSVNILSELSEDELNGIDPILDDQMKSRLVAAGYKITKKGFLDQRKIVSAATLAKNKLAYKERVKHNIDLLDNLLKNNLVVS